jgi:hypothetical protein
MAMVAEMKKVDLILVYRMLGRRAVGLGVGSEVLCNVVSLPTSQLPLYVSPVACHTRRSQLL